MSHVDLHSRDLPVISVCTGGRGLDLALELALPGARSIAYLERESYPLAQLVAALESGLVAPAAVFSDARTFNGRRFRGCVAGVIGGIPCQEWSLAGQRRGDTGERDLWAPFRRILVQSGAWFCLVENVGGILTAGKGKMPGAERIRRDLRRLGFEVAGGIVRASDVGLPHERERVFILGVRVAVGLADGNGVDDHGRGLIGSGRRRQPADSGDGVHAGVGLADPGNPGLSQPERGELRGARRRGQGRAASQLCGVEVDDALRGRHLDQNEALRPGRDGVVAAGGPEMVDAIGGGHNRRSEVALRGSARGDAEQLPGALCDGEYLPDPDRDQPAADGRDHRQERGLPEGQGGADHGPALSGGSRPTLRPPGPGQSMAWRLIADAAPDLLPALSRYDRFRLAMGDAGLAPDGDSSSGTWVDKATGERVDKARISAAAQSSVRAMADGVAGRIDQLRLLGNGVVPPAGALAILDLAQQLAERGFPQIWDRCLHRSMDG